MSIVSGMVSSVKSEKSFLGISGITGNNEYSSIPAKIKDAIAFFMYAIAGISFFLYFICRNKKRTYRFVLVKNITKRYVLCMSGISQVLPLGRVTVNLVKEGLLSRVILPLCSSTTRFTTARPMPLPSVLWERSAW